MTTPIKLFIALISLVSLIFFSCKKDEEIQTTNTTIVNGQIIDSSTSMPIENAYITLQQEDLFVYPKSLIDTQSNSSGQFHFKFEWNDKHTYSIRVTKSGYKFTNSVFLNKGIEQSIIIKLSKDSN